MGVCPPAGRVAGCVGMGLVPRSFATPGGDSVVWVVEPSSASETWLTSRNVACKGPNGGPYHHDGGAHAHPFITCPASDVPALLTAPDARPCRLTSFDDVPLDRLIEHVRTVREDGVTLVEVTAWSPSGMFTVTLTPDTPVRLTPIPAWAADEDAEDGAR